MLVPSVAAGAIIGKGGETIAQLQKDTGARVKMSKSHDFYPGKYKKFRNTCQLQFKKKNQLNCTYIFILINGQTSSSSHVLFTCGGR